MALNPKMAQYAVIAAVFAIIGLIVFVLPSSTKSVENSIKSLYELSSPGTAAEVVSLAEDSGLYKVVVKLIGPSGTNYAEVWVTKDGKYLTQNMIIVKDAAAQIGNYKSFVDCLYNKGLRIYGVTNQSIQAGVSTLTQLNILGLYSPRIFVSCDGDLLPNCIQAGITQAPSTVYQNNTYAGIFSVGQLANLTACKFG